MRKYLYYGVLLILTLLLPAQQVRLGRLAPAQVLTVRMENGAYVLETDLKDRGRGKTISQAAMDLRANASGEVLLETVDYLLWSEECLGRCPGLPNAFGRAQESIESQRCRRGLTRGST